MVSLFSTSKVIVRETMNHNGQHTKSISAWALWVWNAAWLLCIVCHTMLNLSALSSWWEACPCLWKQPFNKLAKTILLLIQKALQVFPEIPSSPCSSSTKPKQVLGFDVSDKQRFWKKWRNWKQFQRAAVEVCRWGLRSQLEGWQRGIVWKSPRIGTGAVVRWQRRPTILE